ncbi:peptidylprolyl isomerase [Flammeovirgaceae bacterium SG7u.111]|nr:peptidylprolyl isomerase [Flammeovirgaceae bacterium SG7u.132]WPO36517.1 peptidylprolyl isomerase [Flammeovirgaceae bacterium SG7u.111]
MSLKKHLLLSCLIFLGSASQLFSQEQEEKDDVIMTIDTVDVLLSDFEYLYNKNYQDNPKAYTQESLEEYLDLFVKFKLKVMEARSQGIDDDPTYTQEYETYRKQLVEPYLADSKAIEAMVVEAYERMKQEVQASHILVNVSQYASPEDTLKAYKRAMEIYKKAKSGEPFKELAINYSEDPSAKKNGGYLGYFTALQMVYEFESTAFQTPVGEVSKPVRTQFGYHIIYVSDKRPSNGSVKTAHIMIRSTEGMDPADTLAAYRKIVEVEKKLKSGEDWTTLCQQFSEDMITKSKGGELKWFSAGSMLETYAEAAFKLKEPGDFSEPIRTPYGWHIIKLIDREPLDSFKNMQSQLKRKVSRDSRSATTKKRFIEGLKKEYGLKENAKVKKKMLAQFDDRLLKGVWEVPDDKKLLSSTLLTLADKRQDVNTFYQYVKKNQLPNRDSLWQDYALRLYTTFVEETLLMYEESQLATKYPEFRHLEREYQEGLLLFQVMENEVWSPATKDTTGLRIYFEENQGSYQWNERAEASIFSAESQTLIDSLKIYKANGLFTLPGLSDKVVSFEKASDSLGVQAKKIVDSLFQDFSQYTNSQLYTSATYVKGEPKSISQDRFDAIKERLIGMGMVEELIREPSQNKKAKTEKGGITLTVMTDSLELLAQKFSNDNALAMTVNSSTFEKGENELLDLVTWKVGSSTFEKEGRFYYVLIKELIPAGDKKLSEIRGQVISDYQSFLEEKWLEKLNKKYEVHINHAALQRLVKG